MINSKMTELSLPLYSRNQKRQYGEIQVGVKIVNGRVRIYLQMYVHNHGVYNIKIFII